MPAGDHSATPKSCPACGKTTLKVHRHDITPFTDAEHPAEPISWQCIYCGEVCSRLGGSGRVVAEGRERVVLAPGELETLATYQTHRVRTRRGKG